MNFIFVGIKKCTITQTVEASVAGDGWSFFLPTRHVCLHSLVLSFVRAGIGNHLLLFAFEDKKSTHTKH